MPTGPWALRSEYLVDQALRNALEATPAQLRTMRPAASPQALFPKRTGFAKGEWTINEVLNIDRQTPSYRSWISGIPAMPSVLSDYTWSGSSRNALTSGSY